MEIKIKKLHPDAVIPTYSSAGAACFDLVAFGCSLGSGRVVVDTGLAFEIPEGYEMVVRPCSRLAFKDGIHTFSGTIDSDFRGSVKVLLVSEDGDTVYVETGQRVAQAVIQPVQRVSFAEVGELSDTIRGEGGFGSSGK